MSKNIIIKPILSDKSEKLSNDNVYTFVVDRSCNRIEVKKEIERIYNVKVEAVRTLIVPGKVKTKNTKRGLVKGTKSAYKKAMVKLADSEVIDLFDEL